MGAIRTFKFNKDGLEEVKKKRQGKDWPVVYLINNTKSLYIGETSSASTRMSQHLENPERKTLKEIHILFDDEFNKSAILDIEQSLIQLAGADNKFDLLNKNGGQSQKHNYYQREKYQAKIEAIWSELQNMSLAEKCYDDIINSDLFKFSPYNTLTEEQSVACYTILNDIIDKLEEGIKASTVIHGCAGTGKTVVLINIINKLVTAAKTGMDYTDEEDALSPYLRIKRKIADYVQKHGELKIGFVLPMTSIRATIKKVFTQSKNGLSASMVIGPTDVANEEFDVLLVDEAHRLARYKNISWRGTFKNTCKKLYGADANPEDYTSLDWIIDQSKYAVLVYDHAQTVKGSDITEKQYIDALSRTSTNNVWLMSQMRCKGGTQYIDFLNELFDCSLDKTKIEVENYDLRLFDDVSEMVEAIRAKDSEEHLARVVAGYSWEWISRDCRTVEEVKRKHLEDIEIDGHKYIWNMSNKEWILRASSIDEVGCIHTTQGYDLNYVGVIFGREIDCKDGKIVVDPSKFYDANVMAGTTEEELRQYIINSYKVMMSRGIKGCYVYACNERLREYLRSKLVNIA